MTVLLKNGKLIDYATMTDDYFDILIEDNKINVYKLVTNKESKLYKTLDVSVNLIREDIKEQLNSGIIVNKSEDLGLLLDDLES